MCFLSHLRLICMALLLAAAPWVTHGATSDGRMALGLIVKLKDSKPNSVVRLQASAMPTDTPQRMRTRLAAAAQRKHIPYLIQKPTAFAAQVIHSGHPVAWAEAQAQAVRLRADPDVEWVQVNTLEQPASLTGYTAQTVPSAVTGTWEEQQWWLSEVGVGLEGVANVRSAWTRLAGRTLYGVTLAVLDTGKLAHAAWANRLLPGYDFVSEIEYANDGNGLDDDPTDPGDALTSSMVAANPALYPSPCTVHGNSFHGPSIIGLLAATSAQAFGTSNDQVINGMLPQLRQPSDSMLVLPVRVSGVCGAALSDIIEGMLWAAGVPYQGSPPTNANPARVISLSFGGSGDCTSYNDVLATLWNKGVLVVASAGNGDGTTGAASPTRPASCARVLAATALSKRGLKANYANQISQGVAVAGGEAASFTSTTSSWLLMAGFYGDVSNGETAVWGAGTSYAAPQVAGVAAMMLAVDPNLTVQELYDQLHAQVRPHVVPADFVSPDDPYPSAQQCVAGTAAQNCYCTTTTCGAGILDADKAVAWAVTQADQTGFDPVGPGSTSASVASSFTPERLQESVSTAGTSRTSSGGGGAADELLLGVLLVLVLCGAWCESRQIKSGKP
jgi:serine protease